MNDFAEIVVLVEGRTEQIFIEEIVGPYLAEKSIFMTPIIISKPGQKGGDVKFARVKNDIELHLKQRPDTFLTLFVDYYGIKGDWPGLEKSKTKSATAEKAESVNSETKKQVERLFEGHLASKRFIPYVAMHEFEALLFSEPEILAEHLGVRRAEIEKILSECGGPEEIDDSPDSAPSKRLEKLSSRFKKTTTGIAIAKSTGLAKIRARCLLFDQWMTKIERTTICLASSR